MVKTKAAKSFNWDGEQGDYIRQCITKGGMSVDCTKQDYKAIFAAAPKGVLDFQICSASWLNVSRRLETMKEIKNSTGARKSKAKAKASDPATPASKTPVSKPTPATGLRSSIKKPTKKGKLAARGQLVWETLHSYWTDKANNSRLQFFIVIPSGCRPKDIRVDVAKSGMKIGIEYTWPEYLFEPERVFEGQIQAYGMGVAPGSAKAEGLDKTTEVMKPNDKAAVMTCLSVHLEKKVECKMVGWDGNPTKKIEFHKLDDDEWEQYPLCLMAIGLMVRRAVGDGFVNEEEDDQDFE
jgi:hypothetical protein